jgi:hypothetical protein
VDMPTVELFEGALGGALGVREQRGHCWRDALEGSFLRSGAGHGSTTGGNG